MLGEAGPDLLAVHDPFRAGLFGAGAYAREIGAGRRLGEKLAPHLFAGDERRQEAPLLLLVAVFDDRRTTHAETDHEQARELRVRSFFLLPDDLLDCRGTPS